MTTTMTTYTISRDDKLVAKATRRLKILHWIQLIVYIFLQSLPCMFCLSFILAIYFARLKLVDIGEFWPKIISYGEKSAERPALMTRFKIWSASVRPEGWTITEPRPPQPPRQRRQRLRRRRHSCRICSIVRLGKPAICDSTTLRLTGAFEGSDHQKFSKDTTIMLLPVYNLATIVSYQGQMTTRSK